MVLNRIGFELQGDRGVWRGIVELPRRIGDPHSLGSITRAASRAPDLTH